MSYEICGKQVGNTWCDLEAGHPGDCVPMVQWPDKTAPEPREEGKP